MLTSAPVERPTRFTYVPALDGLRAILVTVVALYHFSLSAGWDPPNILLPGAFFGPSTFFTLSGYLITSLLLTERERSGTINRSGFWGRRFRRLLPSSTAAVLAAVILTALFPDLWGALFGVDVASALASLANWQSIHLANVAEANPGDSGSVFRLIGPLGIFWSLALEEQFYLLLFGLLVISLGRGEKMMQWFVGLLAAVWVLSVCSMLFIAGTPQREFFGTDTRASEVVLGCLLAVWIHHKGLPKHPAWRHLGWISLLIAAYCWAYITEEDAWVLQWGLPAFAFVSCGMILGLSLKSPLSSFLGIKPLTLLGRISYPLYIIHWPIALIMKPDRVHMTGWALVAARFAVSTAIAYLMFRALELPLKSAKFVKWPRGLIIWLIPALGAIAMAVAVSGWN